MTNRAQRRAEACRVARNRRKLAIAKGHTHIAEASDNALAVKHPFDCGRRCLMCHGEKLLHSGARRQREKREAFTHEALAYIDAATPEVAAHEVLGRG